MNGHLLLRADASPAIGTGHVMRCLALAQAWQDAGGTATIASAELPGALAARLEREQIEVRHLEISPASSADADATARLARATAAAWIVVDGYRFAPEFLEQVRAAHRPVLSVDDMAHLARYPVDLVLNQNLGARRELYRGKLLSESGLLLGPRHSLLRREFRRVRLEREALVARPRRLLVTLGGSDAENHTAAILERLAKRAPSVVVTVLAGAANPHVDALQALARRMPFPCDVRVNVENVAALMARADAAITGGGSTVWELAALQLPALIGAISEDQRAIGPALRHIRSFLAWTIENLLEQDLPAEIESLLAAPRDFGGLDASGALRVVEQLIHHPSFCEAVP